MSSSLVFAAHSTTASAAAVTLQVLSTHQAEQDRLRAEVTKAREEHGDMDYETLMALSYLDAVIHESLRVHPPSPFRVRTLSAFTLRQRTSLTLLLVPGRTLFYLSILPSRLSTARRM